MLLLTVSARNCQENLNFELYDLAVIILLCLLFALICVFEAVNDRCNNQAQKHVHCTANDIKISVIDLEMKVCNWKEKKRDMKNCVVFAG